MIELERIDFKNGSSGKTPLNKTNLNKLQDNMQKAINNVESAISKESEEQNTLREDGDLVRRIEISGNSIQEGTLSIEYEAPIESVGDNVNLFDKDNITPNGFLSQSTGGIASSTGSSISDYIEITPLEDYIISGFGTESYYKAICFYDKDKTFISAISVTNSNDTYSGNAPATAKYLRFHFQNSKIDYIKLEKGTKATPYSPYGQGSIEIYNCNKNRFNKNAILKNTIASATTGNLSANNVWNTSDLIPCRPNATYIRSSKTTGTTNIYLIEYDKNNSFIKVNYGVSFITSENTKYLRLCYRNDIGMYDIQLEESSTVTDYVEGESQTKALYTQQPFRRNGELTDTFIKQNGVCHEKHNIIRKILNGTENWVIQLTNDNVITFRNDGTQFNGIIPAQEDMSNMFANDLTSGGLSKANCFRIANHDNRPKVFFCLPLSSGITTVELWKTKLAELYNAGTPVYVDCQLETPTLIECTAEQVEVLNDIYSAYGEGMTNIICNDEIEPVIEIVKETKETVQSENDKAISMLLARIEELEKKIQ